MMQATDPHQLMLNEALNIITHFEGFREQAYLCPANVWTVGHGFTTHPDGRKVRQGDILTLNSSLTRLRAKIEASARQITQAVQVPLNPYQLAALVSFVFNVGIGAFRTSTLKRLLDAGDYAGAAKQFDAWTKANGQRLEGLVRRRKAERELFTKPNQRQASPSPAPTPRPTLRHGMRDPAVTELQRLLRLPAKWHTGYFGDVTLTHVKVFQRANGLVDDGIVGAATWAKLLQK